MRERERDRGVFMVWVYALVLKISGVGWVRVLAADHVVLHRFLDGFVLQKLGSSTLVWD